MKKRVVITLGLVLATMMIGASGCGGSSGQGGNAQTAENASAESSADNAGVQKTALKPGEIYEKIKATYTLPEMYEADADWLMNYYGIDAGMLSDYVFAEADEVHADRVIILNVADSGNVAEVKEKLEAVLGQLSSQEMLDYLPDQADIITSARIKQEGNTLYLVISPDAEGIEEIIKSGLLGE
ncbi:DUF4358 domain-containing protein [Butyrivibrio sp. LC3010]|uniref:DUF4358 domain-containing protein n=1 Tax=Butyrivibrio sp. LC3010 TaxID=1280680 RepID=UPI00041B4EE4|nr:DUF4358 domain-containing protein [Butyrivibrio sp. LC3010]